jgi:hypothetical protein
MVWYLGIIFSASAVRLRAGWSVIGRSVGRPPTKPHISWMPSTRAWFLSNFAITVIRIRFFTRVYILQGCLPPKKYPPNHKYLKFGIGGVPPPLLTYNPWSRSVQFFFAPARISNVRFGQKQSYLWEWDLNTRNAKYKRQSRFLSTNSTGRRFEPWIVGYLLERHLTA